MRYLLVLLVMGFMSSVVLAQETMPKGLIKQDGRMSPALTLINLDGESYDIKQSRGKWVFVHFWASWCGPCRREMPTVQQLSEKLDSSRWEILLINTAEDEDTVFSFISAVAPDMVPLMDKDGLATEKWRARGLPSTYLVDREGRIRYVALGGRPWDKPEYVKFLQTIGKR